MKTFNRICIKDWSIEAENGDRQECKRGKEYLTSAEQDGVVVVFSGFWVSAPVGIFGGEQEFTK